MKFFIQASFYLLDPHLNPDPYGGRMRVHLTTNTNPYHGQNGLDLLP